MPYISYNIPNLYAVPPSITESKSELSVNQGQSIRLLCEVVGNPRPQIAWMKNGLRISESDPHYFISESGSLEIFSADRSDTAIYICTASNNIGVMEKPISLVVNGIVFRYFN